MMLALAQSCPKELWSQSLTAQPNTALICLKLPPTAQTLLIPYKKEEPDGHEQLLWGLRMSVCVEMPKVPATVYLEL